MEMAVEREYSRRQGQSAAIAAGDEYATFYALSGLDDKGKNGEKNALALWRSIYRDYQRMRFWFDDRELYHKIGYLITVKKKMKELLAEAQKKGKDDFLNYVNDCIRKTLPETALEKLRYGRNNGEISNCLLLFNILSLLGSGNAFENSLLPVERYPFAVHKQKKNVWSLEHIHAQQDQGLTTQKQWKAWMEEHKQAFHDMNVREFTEATDSKDHKEEIEERFKAVEKILKEFNFDDDSQKPIEINENDFRKTYEAIDKFFRTVHQLEDDDIHSLENLALLRQSDNSSLSNEIFAVKRKKILDLDKNGEFIPLCTRRLFMRYYDNSKELRNLPYWSRKDRAAYMQEIRTTFERFLEKLPKEADHE